MMGIRRRCGARVWSLSFLLIVLVAPCARAEDDAEEERASDTGRFYFYFQGGHAGLLDDHIAGDAELDTPDGFNFVLGGGGGYNFSDHWGIEIQAHGTEPDVRSDSGKIKEFSNIAIVPAIRFRYPVGDGRLVPFITAGVGGSLNEVNDTGDPRVKLEADRTTIVGSIALGLEYFLADDVAVGVSMHSFIYGDAGTHYVIRDQANRIIFRDDSSVNLSAISGLAHLRLFPGQSSKSGQRRLFFADHGPYDTDEVRVYAYALGGHTQIFEKDFGGGVEMEAPGDFNATLGGGLGVNLSRHWGVEVQLVNYEPNLDFPAIGKFAELSTFSVLPTVRFRWPFCGGRLVPYLTAGVGVAFNDINDARETVDQFGVGPVTTPGIEVKEDATVVGTVGIGVEYFLNHHISIGLAMPAYIHPDWDTEIRYGSSRTGPGGPQAGRGVVQDHTNVSGIAGLLQIKAYVP